MARPTDLTYEIVAAAAEALLAKGAEPTVAALRTELGGSDSTISRLLRLWKTRRDSAATDVMTITIPQEVNAVLRGWADGLLAKAREEHAAVLAAEKEERAAADQMVVQRTDELEHMRGTISKLEDVLRERNDQMIKVQADLNSAMSRLAESEQAKVEVVRRLEQVRREVAEAEKRAALAEQRAMFLEQIHARMIGTTESGTHRAGRGAVPPAPDA